MRVFGTKHYVALSERTKDRVINGILLLSIVMYALSSGLLGKESPKNPGASSGLTSVGRLNTPTYTHRVPAATADLTNSVDSSATAQSVPVHTPLDTVPAQNAAPEGSAVTLMPQRVQSLPPPVIVPKLVETTVSTVNNTVEAITPVVNSVLSLL